MRHLIRQFPSLDRLAAAAAELVVQVTRDGVRDRGRAMIALAGGSTPRTLYQRLAEDETLRAAMPWSDLHVFWGDERHVPPSHADSNYGMARRELLDRVPVPAGRIHRVRAEWPDAEAAASDYEATIRQVFDVERGVVPVFDLILLGMGTDGHTASIFPGSPALHEPLRLVMAPFVETLGECRITLTARVLNRATSVIVLVGGSEKASVLRAVLEGPDDRSVLPAQLLRDSAGHVEWFVDEDAAARLSGR
jgi:6-phosphogluconolactonase